ncbi:MAG: malate/lactate/ureidoglycolate dehydrogenase [Geminicoccaceae bacterium]|nr:malate/lactate/ureidoglycolate dehydrogenase [Geminicoccaceae bacterium]
MPTFTADQLHAMTREICTAGGSEPREAGLVADHLVAANLAGHDSHGIGMLPAYMENLIAGRLVANQHASLVRDNGALVVVEGNRGYGQVIGFEAMELASERAKKHSVALCAIRNTFHLGRIGHWGEQCAGHGLASIHFVNGIDHGTLQAPYGGAKARLSTNPFCVALPGPAGPSVVLDMATTKIAMGKARVAFNKGVEVPEGSVIDADGFLTRNPEAMFAEPRGALVSMGDHKGSGLAILCELMAGALTGGWTNQPDHPQAGGIVNNMLSIVVDPEAMGERRALYAEIEALVAWVKSSPPRAGFEEVLVPGEPEARRRAERSRDGIEVDQRTFGDIRAGALSLGIDESRFAAFFG